MCFDVHKLSKQDLGQFIELILLFEEVFEMENFQMPDRHYLQQVLEEKHFLAFVALSDGKVAGGLTAYILPQYYSRKPLAYIYDLAVKEEYQRQGIGKQLLSEITSYCKKAGVEEVFVQADEVDIHAVEFYQATGGTAEKVIHFNYPLQLK